MPPLIAAVPNITFGFSEASDGDMSRQLGLTSRRQYLLQQGLPADRAVYVRSDHGNLTSVVTAKDGDLVIDGTDGLITAEANLILVATAGDCLLIYAVDPICRIIGLLHAGRKGLGQQAVTEFLRTWSGAFPKSKMNDLVIDVSPSICANHYAISPQQAEQFAAWPEACHQTGQLVQLDLRNVALAQLLSGGVVTEHIGFSPTCTFENTKYFSYRRDRPQDPQVQVGYIMRRV